MMLLGGYIMKTKNKRATIYLDSELHKALRIKAAETEHSISELVNDAIRSIQGPALHIMPTPEAFEFFNKCVRDGKKVALIAHSTC